MVYTAWLPNGAKVDGVVNLNGSLVVLRSTPTASAIVLASDEVRVVLTPEGRVTADQRDGACQQEANMVFEIKHRQRVGSRGHHDRAD
jgi:hypothetical protein